MKQIEDVSQLCSVFELGSEKERGVRDIIQGEITFQEGKQTPIIIIDIIYLVIFNRLLVCRDPLDEVNSEYVVDKGERESDKQSIDIVYKDFIGKRRFCFELKNLRIQDLKIGESHALVKGQENYDQLKELSNQIARMNPSDVMKLELRESNYYEKWFQTIWAPTVESFMERVKNDVIKKYQAKLQADDQKEGRALAWILVRVGLGKVLFLRVF